MMNAEQKAALIQCANAVIRSAVMGEGVKELARIALAGLEKQPVMLPSAFMPTMSNYGLRQIVVMRQYKNGSWLNKTGVILALREAGIQIEGEE